MAEAPFQPNWFSKPGDTLFNLMERQSLSLDELARKMNYDASLVRGVLAGNISIDIELAKCLEESVGGSTSFWMARQKKFDDSLNHATEALSKDEITAWLKQLPLKDMMEAGWISATKSASSALKSSLVYFDVSDPDEWHERYAAFANSFSFRASPTFKSKVGSLAAWLRQGEIESMAVNCSAWNEDRFRECLYDIRVLTKAKDPAYFIPRLREKCAHAGVAVVFVRSPSGSRASGATRFLSRSKAMIILSFRHLSDDHFWFTFFHEAGHLLLHGTEATFIDGEAADYSEKEQEANEFAASALVPPDRQEALMSIKPRMQDIIRFALSVGVSPGIIVGQLQHRKVIAQDKMNHLKRRYSWDQIIKAIS